MPLPNLSFGRKMLAGILVYVMVTGALMGLANLFQLEALTKQEQDSLGQALLAQLAETVRDPLLENDIISLQVIIDQLVNQTPQVERVSVYDSRNRLLAQSQSHFGSENKLNAYTAPVTVDNTITGQVRLELNVDRSRAPYLQLTASMFTLWLLSSVVFGVWLTKNATALSARIARISRQLATDSEGADDSDELTRLENQLIPLLSEENETSWASKSCHCLLGIYVANMPRLRAQLNTEHFNQILDNIDTDLNRIMQIYRGERLLTLDGYAYIRFAGHEDSDNELLHAVSLGAALIETCREGALTDGLALEMKIAIAVQSDSKPGHWREGIALQKTVDRLQQLFPLVGPWEMVIDSNLIEGDELPFCDCDPLADSDAQLFRHFTPQQQLVYERQIAFLRQRSAATA